jgi:hypothetical protein
VITKCEFTYIQLENVMSQSLPSAHACRLGSKKRPSARSASTRWRAFSKASPAWPSTMPRTIRYR